MDSWTQAYLRKNCSFLIQSQLFPEIFSRALGPRQRMGKHGFKISWLESLNSFCHFLHPPRLQGCLFWLTLLEAFLFLNWRMATTFPLSKCTIIFPMKKPPPLSYHYPLTRKIVKLLLYRILPHNSYYQEDSQTFFFFLSSVSLNVFMLGSANVFWSSEGTTKSFSEGFDGKLGMGTHLGPSWLFFSLKWLTGLFVNILASFHVCLPIIIAPHHNVLAL